MSSAKSAQLFVVDPPLGAIERGGYIDKPQLAGALLAIVKALAPSVLGNKLVGYCKHELHLIQRPQEGALRDASGQLTW